MGLISTFTLFTVYVVVFHLFCRSPWALPLPAHHFSRQQEKEIPLIVGSLFQLFQPSSDSGCPNNVTHKVIRESNNSTIQAVINFDDIQVNGMSCEYESSSDELYIVNYEYARDGLSIGNPLNLSSDATNTISIAGVDNGKRRCGTYLAEHQEMYYFVKNLGSIWNELDEGLIPEYASVDASSVFGQSLWMLSLPLNTTSSQRVCIFKGLVPTGSEVDEDGDENPRESDTEDSESEGEEATTPPQSDDDGDEETTSDTPVSSGTPVVSDIPNVSDSPDMSDTPETSQSSDSPDTAASPASPENPDTPEDPDTPDTPDSSDGSETSNDDDSNDDSSPGDESPSGNIFPEAASEAEKSSMEPDSNACFPAEAVVRLSNGIIKRMDELKLMDEVQTGVDKYSPILTFSHREANELHKFIVLQTRKGRELTLTPSHIIYLGDGRLIATRRARVGDSVIGEDGNVDNIVELRQVVKKGLFNPQTVDGDIVVNGLKTSTYTEALRPSTAHGVLLPLRAALKLTGWAWRGLDSGAPAVIGPFLRPDLMTVCNKISVTQ